MPYRFFRVEADLEIKATGERIRFDYIAWCGGTVTHWRAGSPSIQYNLYPEMMHQATSDGAAIGIRTFNMCDAWTWENDKEGNSRIPDDLLPVVRWYPDVNDMGFAIGYESDAAYESPYSKLLFHGASLTWTDAGTWADWRKSYEAGFKPVGDIDDPYFDTNTPSRIVQSCNLSTRVIVPPELVREAESLVPEGTGRFWPNGSAADTESEALSAAAFRELIAMPDWKYRGQIAGHDLNDFKRTGQWLGPMTRSGGGQVKNRNTDAPYTAYADAFPVIMSLAEEPDKRSGRQGIVDLTVPVSADCQGFSICGYRFVTQEKLRVYSVGDLPKESLGLRSVADFNWHDDGDPETNDAWVRRQTTFRTYVGNELAAENALP